MVEGKTGERIARDFEFLRDRVLAVLVFGSAVNSESYRDVDICIVAPGGLDIKEVFEKVDVAGKGYDVWIFEDLPLYMKMEVIENHVAVFCRDILELHEYFYFYRKLWKDQRRRNVLGREELLDMLDDA